MTPSELRALDLLMAEKVMGWRQVSSLLAVSNGIFAICSGGEISYRQNDNWQSFHPTESPADAMMVLKKVGLTRRIAIDYFHDSKLWSVYAVTKDSKLETSSITGGASLELAICLFAREVCG